VTEAGFFPGIILYLTYWVPARYRAAIVATFMTSTTFSGMIGNPLAGLLMQLDGVSNLHGWQWLFLIEGLIPVVLGVVVFFVLPDGPDDVRWLSQSDKDWIAAELRAEHAAATHHGHHLAALADTIKSGRLWLLAGIYFMAIMGLYGLTFWAPTLIKATASGASNLRVGFLSAIPYFVGAVSMVLIGRHSDRTGERRKHIATTTLIAAAGMAIVSLGKSEWTVTAFLCLAAVGIFATFGPFWALATRYLAGSAAAGGIAVVNSIGNLAGFLAPYAIGFAKDNFGSYTAGLLLVSASLAVGAVLVLCVPAVREQAHGFPVEAS
jgi:MFS transporter, ACS family, tartrate transporter